MIFCCTIQVQCTELTPFKITFFWSANVYQKLNYEANQNGNKISFKNSFNVISYRITYFTKTRVAFADPTFSGLCDVSWQYSYGN